MKILSLGYLYKGKTVVMNKENIKGSKEEDFKEISLVLTIDDIKEIERQFDVVKKSDDYRIWCERNDIEL